MLNTVYIDVLLGVLHLTIGARIEVNVLTARTNREAELSSACAVFCKIVVGCKLTVIGNVFAEFFLAVTAGGVSPSAVVAALAL